MSNTLETFARIVGADWGPLSTALIDRVRGEMRRLIKAPATEAWLHDLRRAMPTSQELLRDPRHGFVLQAHAEPAGLYRPPHDHGRSWVIYAVVDGAVEMGTYGRALDARPGAFLVKRDATLMRAGDVQVYLPGDIHDTRCMAGPALLLRFTERDLKAEADIAHRMIRYVERDGQWVAP